MSAQPGGTGSAHNATVVTVSNAGAKKRPQTDDQNVEAQSPAADQQPERTN